MDQTQALILSIVEGISEFLPISSTGHLVLTSQILNIPQTNFVKSFEIFIQLGAILAVVILYFKTLINNFKLWKNIVLAFIPSAILGLLFYHVIKAYLLGNIIVTLAALLLGGIVLIFLEKILPKRKNQVKDLDQLTPKQAILIGLAQSVSMIPGVSRSAATIVGGLFLGLNKKPATEFSFLLAIPTMMAATALDLFKSDFAFSQDQVLILLIGFVGAFITAMLAVKFFIQYIQNHSLFAFGVYRIILALAFWFFTNN
jgi:undecaprenyl-diphosphatase